MTSPHLLVAISGHGYGHLSQVAPVLRALVRRLPGLRLTLRTRLSEVELRPRVGVDFELLPAEVDFGMRMHSAIEVDVEASARDYAAFHHDWERRVADEAAVLEHSGADLLLADIPYLSLAAARRAGIPAVAMCSLNWADIYQQYCGHLPGAEAVLQQITDAYRGAELFLRPRPSMPMDSLENTRAIGPVARRIEPCRDKVAAMLGLADGERVLLVGMGGIDLELPLAAWPRFPGWRLIASGVDEAVHPDVLPLESLPISYGELLGGVDALLTKVGYGSYVEAASLGLPVLYVSRPDWPEQPWANPWLEAKTRATEVDASLLRSGQLLGPLQALMARPPTAPVPPGGVDEAAAIVAALLQRQPTPTTTTEPA